MSALRGVYKENESLARHTSWRVGGAARRYYEPADLADLAAFLRSLPVEEPLLWLGLGSNLLVRDGGFRGTVISTAGALAELEQVDENTVRAQAGVTCAKLARFCAQRNLGDAEFFAGIPGTVGGALAMNAGAFGGETWPLVVQVETLDRRGELRMRPPEGFEIAYRSVKGPRGEWFVAGHFRLGKGAGAASQQRVKELLERRNQTQPTHQPSGGSTFRNPPGDHAGRLIEAAGLKGRCRGGACVSEKHANFIVNTGSATAADIEALMMEIKEAVRQAHGIDLIAEVHIVGESA